MLPINTNRYPAFKGIDFGPSIDGAGMSYFRNIKLVVPWFVMDSLTAPKGEDEISCPSSQHCTTYVTSQDVLDQKEKKHMCKNMCV